MNRTLKLTGVVVATLASGTAALAAIPGLSDIGPSLNLRSSANGAPLFSEANIDPGAMLERCVIVTNAGTSPGRVSLSGTRGSGRLGPYLRLSIQPGEQASASRGSCDGFLSADQPAIFDKKLDEYSDRAETAVRDPQIYPAGYSRAYRFRVAVARDAPEGTELDGQAFTFSGEPLDSAAVSGAVTDVLPDIVFTPAAPPTLHAVSGAPYVPQHTSAPTSGAGTPARRLIEIRILRVAADRRGRMLLTYHATGRARVVVRGRIIRSRRAPLPPGRRLPAAAPHLPVGVRQTIVTRRARHTVPLRISSGAWRVIARHPGHYAIRMTITVPGPRHSARRTLTIPSGLLTSLATRRSAR
jgi:hypothetical protein